MSSTSSKGLIVILCNDYDEAEWGFGVFLEFLSFTQPDAIVEIRDYCCEIETDCDLVYKFVDYHYIPRMDISDADKIGLDNFLMDMDSEDPMIYF